METSELMSILKQEHHLGKVIHTQIYIENLINNYLHFAMENPKYLKPLRLDYDGKVHLAIALGFSEELKEPLSMLGKMRNGFAHTLDKKIDSSYMNNFYKSFSSCHREEIMKTAKDTNQSWMVGENLWKKVPPVDQFNFMCITLYYLCISAIQKIKYKKEMDKLCNSICNVNYLP